MLRTGRNEDAHAAEACALPFRAGRTVRDWPETHQLTDRIAMSDRTFWENARRSVDMARSVGQPVEAGPCEFDADPSPVIVRSEPG